MTTLEIVIHGRGGQGAQVAGNLLAMAFFAEGREVQCFATYGGARRGTPVASFLRVDDKPIRLRCDIEQADALLVFDASLLDARLLCGARPGALVVVNSRRPSRELAAQLAGYRVVPIDGIGIAQRHGLGRIVNSALLGALARAVQAPSLASLERTIAGAAPKHADKNVAACLEGYRRIEAELGALAA